MANWSTVMNIMMPPYKGQNVRITNTFEQHLARSADRRRRGVGGVDISYPSQDGGGPIYSPINGRIAVINGSMWNTVYLYDAKGNQHGFLHMSAITVKNGQQVQAGTQLGFEGGMGPNKNGSGKTNNAYGKHLHYEIKLKSTGRFTDPVKWWNDGQETGAVSPQNPVSPEEFVTDNIVKSGGDTPSNGAPPPPPVGTSSEYAPRPAEKSQASNTSIAVWTNRVPTHEPWPRVMLVDETVNDITIDVEYNVNHEPQYSDDGTEEHSGKIGRIDGIDVYVRGDFWRR